MCRDELYRHLINEGARLGKCFDDECGGYFYPEEIEKAFELLAERDGTPVSDGERAALAAYRNRFPVLNGGRSALPSLDSFIHPMQNGKCSTRNMITQLDGGNRIKTARNIKTKRFRKTHKLKTKNMKIELLSNRPKPLL
jgi:hypothetical protein